MLSKTLNGCANNCTCCQPTHLLIQAQNVKRIKPEFPVPSSARCFWRPTLSSSARHQKVGTSNQSANNTISHLIFPEPYWSHYHGKNLHCVGFFYAYFLIVFHFTHTWGKGTIYSFQTANLAVAQPPSAFPTSSALLCSEIILMYWAQHGVCNIQSEWMLAGMCQRVLSEHQLRIEVGCGWDFTIGRQSFMIPFLCVAQAFISEFLEVSLTAQYAIPKASLLQDT